MEIGNKLKEMRLKNQLTQEELADRCELTKGYISQLENDLNSPSIETLRDILISLGSSLSEFFSGDEDEKVVFTADDHFEKETADCTIKWLVPTSQKNEMEPIIMTIAVGCSSGKDLPHDGEEFGYVLSGDIVLVIGKKEYTVKKDQSFYFRSSKTHFIKNVGSSPSTIVWVSSPPNF